MVCKCHNQLWLPVLVVTSRIENNTGYYNDQFYDQIAYWVNDDIFYTLRVFGSIENQADIQFKAAWQDFSKTIVNSTLVKLIVDIGTGLTNIINGIATFAGGTGVLSGVIVTLGAIEQKCEGISKLFINLWTGITTPIKSLMGGAKRCPYNTPITP